MEQDGEYPDREHELLGEELQPTAPTCSPQDTSTSCSNDHGGNAEVWEAGRHSPAARMRWEAAQGAPSKRGARGVWREVGRHGKGPPET
jgi:hypothetical protein